jgi:Holliday junction resolvase
MTPEGRVKEQVKKVLKTHGIWYFMPAANGYGKVGVPDFICCWRGRFLAIETKAPGKRDATTANQKVQIGEIQKSEGWALVVDDVAQLNEFINHVKEDPWLSQLLKN